MQDELLISDEQVSREAGHRAEEVVSMNEAEFRALYERTARSLWSYLCRVLGNPSLADDLLQEAYIRILRVPTPPRKMLTGRIIFSGSPRI